ncbi:MAG: EFR1 family ferrodoxin [Clostridiales bacterium]|nr:EFR1 family ferrodoxin [Candidatus Crickella merdequi]
MILYFTGTGNSRYVAEKVAEATGDTLLDIGERYKSGDVSPIDAGERLVICTPTYAWRIPAFIDEWLRQVEFTGSRRTWFVMTCGGNICNAGKYNEALCRAKHLNYMGTAEIKMPENYIAMFDAPEDDRAREIIAEAEPSIQEAIESIRIYREFKPVILKGAAKLMSGPVNKVFYAAAVKDKKFRTLDNCIGCGKCVSACVMNNIAMEDGKPVWNGNCTHCMACIAHCPVEAIEYGDKSVGQPRYHI